MQQTKTSGAQDNVLVLSVIINIELNITSNNMLLLRTNRTAVNKLYITTDNVTLASPGIVLFSNCSTGVFISLNSIHLVTSALVTE